MAISYLEDEETDAHRIIELINDAGRKGAAAARRPDRPDVLPQPGRPGRRGARRAGHPGQQRGRADPCRGPGRPDRRAVRRDLQDQRVRDVLDHQGRPAAPASPERRSSTHRRSRPTTPRPDWWTTPPPRPRSTPSPRRWPSSWPRKGIRVNVGRAGSGVDAAADRGRSAAGEAARVRPEHPAGPAGQPAELAPAYVFLASAGVQLRGRRDPERQRGVADAMMRRDRRDRRRNCAQMAGPRCSRPAVCAQSSAAREEWRLRRPRAQSGFPFPPRRRRRPVRRPG